MLWQLHRPNLLFFYEYTKRITKDRERDGGRGEAENRSGREKIETQRYVNEIKHVKYTVFSKNMK